MSDQPSRRARLQLVGLLLVFAAPVLAAYGYYYFGPTTAGRSYGELLAVGPLPDVSLPRDNEPPMAWSALRGKWLLVMVDGGDCPASCRDKLYRIRQIRLALGKDQDRLDRVWLLSDGQPRPDDLPGEYAGTRIFRAQGSPLLSALPEPEGVSSRDEFWLVDPLGNLVLRYPREFDPKRVIKDLERLLKVSQIG